MKTYNPGPTCHMNERADGDYVRRDDAESLAAALLELVQHKSHTISDLVEAKDEAAADGINYRRALKAAVKRLVDAKVAYSWKGSHTDVAYIAEIEIELREAQMAYNKCLGET